MNPPPRAEMFVHDTTGIDRAGPGEVRLLLELASYAYHARDRAAPLFTLEATSLSAHQRQLVAILGPNASGKSTLLRLMAGALAPLSGRVQLDGFEVSKLDARTRAQRIALTAKGRALVPLLAADADSNDAQFFSRLSAAERKQLLAALRHLAAALDPAKPPID